MNSHSPTIHQSSLSSLLGISVPSPKPFLKWAGGKTQLLDQITPLLPKTFAGYFEPFIGSAAVYFRLFALKQDSELGSPLARVWLTDSNEELINCYEVVRDHLPGLIHKLEEHKRKHSRDYYYEVIRPNRPSDPIERAARLIYLNKTCFNGLYRVNRQGQFNVPMGSYKNPGIFDRAELETASDALQGKNIDCKDFREVYNMAKKGDFIYFDPPYYPLNATSSFTSYTEAQFGKTEQEELAKLCLALHEKGCMVMLSNSWTPFIVDLYQQLRVFEMVEVQAARAINSKADRRGKISELVAINYDPAS